MNNLRTMKIRNVVVGSGAAGYATAIRLFQLGENDTVIVTEDKNAGTSRNTGSDKQTYYKLSLADGEDSVLKMAEALMQGGAVDGDLALSEAALSVRGFFNLVELGVPFPCTEYGEYIGYKTDHDNGKRATSAGPYTSRIITEKLERKAEEEHIEVISDLQLVHIFTEDGRLSGALFYERQEKDSASFILIRCENLILATGGPAELYHDSVYPSSQFGASGVAYECGIHGQNLTEWQFGMSSLSPRWNVSGTYMQVLPRFISRNPDGTDEREFLLDHFLDKYEMMSKIFLKGYQWPFDVRKILNGSSIIDLLVYQESILKGRKVYLDFTKNSCGEDIDFNRLSAEAMIYLKNAGALVGTPIERLKKMNNPAVQFYIDHRVDLSKDYLEIAICAQHNNGGLSVDKNWETSIHGIYAAGEAAGTHGIFRPGGSALNAGQTAAIRIAETIHRRVKDNSYLCNPESLYKDVETVINSLTRFHGDESARALYTLVTKNMSKYAAMIRNSENLRQELQDIKKLLLSLTKLEKKPEKADDWIMHFHLRDTLITAIVYLSAMIDYTALGHGSRGSALYTDKQGELPYETFPETFRFRIDVNDKNNTIQECVLKWNQDSPETEIRWRTARPIPDEDYFFEKQWTYYRSRLGYT